MRTRSPQCPPRPWNLGPGSRLLVCRHDCACAQDFNAMILTSTQAALLPPPPKNKILAFPLLRRRTHDQH